jgi:peptide/nickel transport system substrate-binding protein
MKFAGTIRRLVGVGIAVTAMSAATLALAPASVSGAATSTPTTATWAEPPQAPPNYIFPFMSLAFFSVYNSEQFQYLMYRPLYWFGDGATPNLNLPLSLAAAPTYNNTANTVTVDLNNYKWSNGETVTAENVMFWMNMLHAEKANWAGYSAGAIPDDVKSIVINNPEQLTFTLTAPVNNYWFTYNELSQITPMPNAWDITAKGGAPNSGGCAAAPYGTADAQCKAVYTFLSKQAGYDPSNPKAANNSLSTYATNPIWQVVDGPWKLSHFDAEGNVTFVPNPTYSGPVKPTLTKFIELPFTSDSAEFNALVGGKVNVGYLPTQDITKGTTTSSWIRCTDGPSTTSPTTSTRQGTVVTPARSTSSSTSARPCSTWWTSRCTTTRSSRATRSAPTAPFPASRPTPSCPRWWRTTRTRTTRVRPSPS